MSRSRARLAADWFAKLRQNAETQEVEHTDVAVNAATAAQGAIADTAVQPSDNVSTLTNDAGYTANVGTITGVTAGGGITGGGTSGTVTISHTDTSAQASVNNSGSVYIQDITLDAYGHVTAIGSTTVPSYVPTTQSTATWQAGTGTTQSLVSPANVKSAITALAQGGATTFISKATASNTTQIIFTGFNSSLYDSYQFTIAGIKPSLANRYFAMKFSTNGGATWVGGENLFAFGLSLNGLSMSLGVIGAHLNRPTLTTKLGAGTANSGAIYAIQGGYPFSVSGINNAIMFQMSAGAITSGEITMYGLRKS